MPKTARPARPHSYASFVTFVTLCLIGALLYAAQEVLVPLALSVLLAFLLAPLATRLQRWHVPRVPAALFCVILAVGVIGAIVWAMESQFVDVVNKLPDYQGQIREKVARLRHSGGSIGHMTRTLQDTVKAVTPATTLPATSPADEPAAAPASPVDQKLGQVTGTAPKPGTPSLPNVSPENPLPVRNYPESTSIARSVTGYLSSTLHPLATGFVVLIFVIFLLLGRDDLRDRVVRLAGGAGRLDLTTQALDDAASRVSRYLVAQSIVNATYAVLVAGGLWLIGKTLGGDAGGFPNVLLFGLLCGLFRFVPYLGPWLGAALPLAIAFGFFPNNAVFVAVLAMFVGLELTVSQVAEPLLYGSSTGLSPIAVLVAAAFWAWLWGTIGLLLSTPITVVLVVLGRYVPQLHFLHVLLGDEPVLSPAARLYQRLVALDREQAGDVAAAYLKEKGLEAAYDDMLLPTLAMAEHNRRRGSLNRRGYAFVRSHVRDLTVELAELAKVSAAADHANAGGQPPVTQIGDVAIVAEATNGNGARVVCVPAHGRSDEIAGMMLQRVLEHRGVSAWTVKPVDQTGALPGQAASERADVEHADAVCISAVPPASAAHARSACRRLAGDVQPGKLVVGLWTSQEPVDEANHRRIACDPAVKTTGTLAGAASALQERLDKTLPDPRTRV